MRHTIIITIYIILNTRLERSSILYITRGVRSTIGYIIWPSSVKRVSAPVYGHGPQPYVLEAQTDVHFQIPHPDLDVFAHQVEAHGNDAHAQQQVHELDDQLHRMVSLGGGVLDGAHRHEVLDADLAQAGDAEKRAVQHRPLFERGERHRAGGHVRRQHPQAGRGRHDHPRLLGQLLVVRVAADLVLHAALIHPRVQPPEALCQHLMRTPAI